MQQNAEFIKITSAGYAESQPHDVACTLAYNTKNSIRTAFYSSLLNSISSWCRYGILQEVSIYRLRVSELLLERNFLFYHTWCMLAKQCNYLWLGHQYNQEATSYCKLSQSIEKKISNDYNSCQS